MTFSVSKRNTPTISGRYFRSPRTSSSSSGGTYKPSPLDFIGSFYAVLNRWQSETAFLSDPDEITNHPSFKALVENAKLVLPLIIAELKIRPSLLVWVLDDAIGDSPYPESAVGDIRAMSEAWIAWGESNGFTL
jgi:hypothetical protein